MPDSADIIFTGGSLFSGGWQSSRRAAVALRNGSIHAIGSDDEIRALAGPQTDVVDLAGGLLAPGFQDAHVHPVVGGLEMLACNLVGAISVADCLLRVEAYAEQHRDDPWVIGGGWSMEFFPGGLPTRELLDAVVSDRPVALTNRDHHGSWVNSRALELAGIDATTPDPPDGRIERDVHGVPTGVLQEGAAFLLEPFMPVPTPSEQHRALMTAQSHLLSLGITAWQDAAVGNVFGQRDVWEVYRGAAQSGDLVARVIAALWWERDRGPEQIAELIERRTLASAARFRATSVKIMQDGVPEYLSAAMIEPYLDSCRCPTDHSGSSFVDANALKEYVTALDSLDFQVHFHAIGDRAVRECLDALEAARGANGPRENRHHLAHLQVVTETDVPRFAALDATATIQPFWAAHGVQMDELTMPLLGVDRSARQYVFAELVRAGISMAGGSDWPVSTANPLDGMQVAVTRREPGDTGPAFYPDNAITLAQMFSAYTAGSARVNRLDHETGSLTEGLRADLVVLDRDPFAGPAEEIASARVRRTYIDGACVYSADG